MTTKQIEHIVHTTQTTGTATSNMANYAIPASAVCNMVAQVVARSSDGVSRSSWSLFGVGGREAGTGALVATALNMVAARQDAGAVTWTATVAVSGNNLCVQIGGGLVTTIDWMVHTEVMTCVV